MPVVKMPEKYDEADAVARIAAQLIPQFHPVLATARIQYLFTTKEMKKNKLPLVGKAVKVPLNFEFTVESDFQIIVSLPVWNDLTESQRRASVDSLLSRCHGEESESTGEIKWKKREPTGEFAEVILRNGAWTEDLKALITVAKQIDLEDLVYQHETVELDDLLTQKE